MTIPYGHHSLSDGDVAAVVEALRSGWLTQGPAVTEFEHAFAEACGAPWAVAFSHGTAALHAAMLAVGLGEGEELVTSAITFVASANAGSYVGAVPRFCDIDPGTFNMSPDTLVDALGERTKVVVPVSFAGLPAPLRQIRERVGDDVVIVEDACHALGALDGEGPVGSCRYADLSAFSLHPVKAIASGEGGMLTGRDENLRKRLLSIRDHGFVRDRDRLARWDGGWYHEQQELGFNFRLSDIHSALGRSQLRRLERSILRRNEVAARYRELLAGIEEITLPPEAQCGAIHAYHLFVIRHRDGAEARRRLYDGLHARGILAQVHYIPVYRHPWYERTFGYREGLCPEAERYYASCLSLPCFPDLARADQDQVVSAVHELA